MRQSKLLTNSLSLLINRLTQGIVTFALTAAIARNLGAYALGQYLLSISYYYIFVNIASQGLKTLFTRELAREPEDTPIYLVNGTLLQFAFSIIGYLALVVVVFLLPYSADTSSICYITGLAVIPFALSNITESIFQAQEKMYLIAVSTVPVYILRLFAMLWAMHLNYGIEYVAIILVISEFIVLAIQWILLTRIVKPKWQIKKSFFWESIKAARTFFAIEGVGFIAGRLDVLVLSLLGSEILVGIYGAVVQLIQPFQMISGSVLQAGFPGMSKAVNLGREKQREVTENVIEMLLCMGLPFFLGILFFGKDLLLIVYQKDSFAEANFILYIVSISVIKTIFTRSFSYLLMANGFEKFSLLEVTITTVVGGLTGVLLVSQYKLLGVAFMIVAMAISNTGILTYAVYTRIFKLRLWRIMRRPLLIGTLMLVVFLILKQINLDVLLTLLLATCAYGLFAILIISREVGGLRYAWQKILNK